MLWRKPPAALMPMTDSPVYFLRSAIAEEGGEEDAQGEDDARVADVRQTVERNEGGDGGKSELCPRNGKRQRKEALEDKEDEGKRCENGDVRYALQWSHIISLRSAIYAGGRQ